MKELTEEQEAAVNSTASLILTDACAGSGKTRVLVERIARTIGSGIHPSRIVAITFTNSAAGELDRRICERMAWVFAKHQRCSWLGYCGTLHGFMVRVLKEYGPRFGYARNFAILSEGQTIELMDEVASEMRYKGTQFELIDAIELLAGGIPNRTLNKTEIVASAFYLALNKNGLLTFDMVLKRGVEVMRKVKETGVEWKYEHLFVDEYQDASDTDAEIYDLMPCSDKFFVGDRKQSIYSFRGGSITHFNKLADNPECHHLLLTLNFRSDETICTAANRLMNGETPMQSATGKPGLTAVRCSLTGEREIAEVADQIRQFEGHSTIAVLLRTNALVNQWSKGLRDMGVTVWARPPSLPDDWDKVLAFLAFCAEPDNDWLAYNAVLKCRGNPVAAKEVRDRALRELKTINQVALNYPRNMNCGDALRRVSTVASDDSFRFLSAIMAQAPPEMSVTELLNEAQKASYPIPPSANGVNVTTYHSAKGMEFDCVILPAFEEGIIPIKTGDLMEEKRLAYVGMTRAKKVLIISFAERRKNQFSYELTPSKPSRFVQGIVDNV